MDLVIDILTLFLSAGISAYLCSRYVFPWIEKSKFLRSEDSWFAERVERLKGGKK